MIVINGKTINQSFSYISQQGPSNSKKSQVNGKHSKRQRWK